MYNIIVAHDKNGGIGINNTLPWHIKEDMGFFRQITTQTQSHNTNKQNCIIMGKNTYNSIPSKFAPLPHRINIILSTSLTNKTNNNNLHIFTNIDHILDYVQKNKKNIEKCFIIGGASIYNQFIKLNLISTVYVTIIDYEYKCDAFFNINNYTQFIKDNDTKIICRDHKNDIKVTISFCKYIYNNVEEQNYLNLMKNILTNGVIRNDRTNTGTISLFGESLKYDLRNNQIPLLTSKFVPFRFIVEELLWMISGSTDATKLQEKKIGIWNGNSTREFLDNRKLYHLPVGDIGAGYGHQLRHFGAKYMDCKTDYKNLGIDQIKYVIDLLKNNPTSRRILFSYWNPMMLNDMALPPCHIVYQFYVNTKTNELSGCLYQRSSDYFLANNYNAIGLCLWIRIFCHLLGFKPGYATHFFADTHIYLNHIKQCEEQLKRRAYVYPTLNIVGNVNDISHFTYNNFKLINYYSCGKIQGKMN